MKLLIDENLSPKLVEWLGARDVPAQHVVYTGMQGATDPEVWRFAFENDFIVQSVSPTSRWSHAAISRSTRFTGSLDSLRVTGVDA